MGANEVELDQLGIGTTRLNARLLIIAALAGGANLSPATGYDEAAAALRRGEVSVMGGVTPDRLPTRSPPPSRSRSTPTCSCTRRARTACTMPTPTSTTTRPQFGSMSPAELVDIVLPMSRNAGGASAPVDLLAAKLIDRAGIRSIVLDGTTNPRLSSTPSSAATTPAPT